MPVTTMTFVSRADLRLHKDWFFLFGDNLLHQGLGGQAREMRREPNAIGIPTKRRPSMHPGSFFTDADFAEAKAAIDAAFALIPAGATVVVPAAGIGTGLAELPRRAPQIYAYIQSRIAALA